VWRFVRKTIHCNQIVKDANSISNKKVPYWIPVRVADHRHVELAFFQQEFTGYSEIAESRWSAWLAKNRLATVPADFAAILARVQMFARP
jgi:hypothetical protein